MTKELQIFCSLPKCEKDADTECIDCEYMVREEPKKRMTNEEIKNKLQRGLALTVKESWDLYKYIEALEQQPCEDCISREAVRRILANQRDELIKLHTVNPKDNPKADAMAYGVNWSLNTLMELPSVTPSIPDVENNFDIGYNCGYADAMCDIGGES